MESLDVFEVLVRENAGMLSTLLRAAVPQEAVDDIWQDTMVTAWRRWDDYDRTRPFGAWLRGIASKNILAWQRKKKRDGLICDANTLDYYGQTFARLHQLDGDTFDEKLDALRRCIESLPERHREVIHLRYEQELMPAAVAETTGRQLEAVKKQLQRAKAMLFACIMRKLGPVAESSPT